MRVWCYLRLSPAVVMQSIRDGDYGDLMPERAFRSFEAAEAAACAELNRRRAEVRDALGREGVPATDWDDLMPSDLEWEEAGPAGRLGRWVCHTEPGPDLCLLFELDLQDEL